MLSLPGPGAGAEQCFGKLLTTTRWSWSPFSSCRSRGKAGLGCWLPPSELITAVTSFRPRGGHGTHLEGWGCSNRALLFGSPHKQDLWWVRSTVSHVKSSLSRSACNKGSDLNKWRENTAESNLSGWRMCMLNNTFSLFLNSAFLLEMILSDSTGSIKDKMGAWTGAGVGKIGLVLKTNSKQMGRAAGGQTRLFRSLGARYLFFVPSCLLGLQFPVFHLQPDSPYLTDSSSRCPFPTAGSEHSLISWRLATCWGRFKSLLPCPGGCPVPAEVALCLFLASPWGAASRSASPAGQELHFMILWI